MGTKTEERERRTGPPERKTRNDDDPAVRFVLRSAFAGSGCSFVGLSFFVAQAPRACRRAAAARAFVAFAGVAFAAAGRAVARCAARAFIMKQRSSAFSTRS